MICQTKIPICDCYSKIEFGARCNVPTQIKVDGKIIPFSLKIFTPEEIKAFQSAIMATGVNTTKTKNEKIMGKPTNKVYKSNDLKEFLK